MKPTNKQFTLTRILTVFVLLTALFIQYGCKKSDNPTSTTPVKFTDLQVNPAFQFDNFVSLNVTISVANPAAGVMSMIQIYDGDPNAGGKSLASGATDASSQYKTSLRVPSRLKELWVGKISADGLNMYAAVPVNGTTFTYTFGQSSNKSTDGNGTNDCSVGTPITVNGIHTVQSGQIYVVQPGVNITNLQLTINQGGTVRVCGTANITKLEGPGTLIVSPSGYVMVPVEELQGTIENYGNLNCAQAGNNKNFAIKEGSVLHNWGQVTMSNGLDVEGTVINEYHFTVVQDAQANGSGRIINYCQFFVNSNSNEAFKITSGSASLPGLVNGPNAYIKVTGNSLFTGQSYLSLGSESLIETGSFKLEGFAAGPAAQGSQIHALGSGSHIAGGTLSGYIDFWATLNPKNGTFGSHITWHNPGYTILAQDCSAPTVPVITSGLVAAGTVGNPITPYVITATGTNPITFNAANLPAGLTYDAVTHTISGTPTTAQVKNVTLTADNLMGTDTKVLVITVTNPPSPPVIVSKLKDHTPVNQPYSYQVDATGSGTISYTAANLPAGLTLNPTTHKIEGIPSVTGVFNIPMTATTPYGTDAKTLVLTIGAPPVITSPLTATATTGQQFITYHVTASGTDPKDVTASNLPAGFAFSDDYHTINGTPSQAGVINVTLTAVSDFGNDSKILVITIMDPVEPPHITSPVTATAAKNVPFSYQVTSTGTKPVVYSVANLPAGLHYDSEFGVISGVPTGTGTFTINISATNSAGTDNKTLVISIPVLAPISQDSDADGVPDNIDAYPNDATRAFNSYYPNEVDYGSYAFEDMWPVYGDYDFNDLVVNFNYKIVTNAQNKVVDLIAKYKVKAAGASFDNGFGISLNTAPSNVESVTGCIHVGSVVNNDPKGYESGHVNNTVFIPVDAVNTLLGRSVINTVRGGYTVQTETHTVTVHLSNPQANIGTPPYNPFIFINQDRGKEVHLKDHAPTELANPVYFGTMNDASNPSMSFYYRSSTGLPWGMEIPVDFSYPVEKADILQTYNHFAAWAQSSGTQYTDWYMDKPGYRNAANVY